MPRLPSTAPEQAAKVLSGEAFEFDVPSYWHLLVQYAHLREIGHTQEQAAAAVDRSERTVQRWESDEEWWPRARIAAGVLWGPTLQTAAKRKLHELLNAPLNHGSVGVGLQFEAVKFELERQGDYAPPAQQHEVSGKHLHGVVELPAMDKGEPNRSLEDMLDEQDRQNGGRAVELPEQDEGTDE